jgi:hypothetical protein
MNDTPSQNVDLEFAQISRRLRQLHSPNVALMFRWQIDSRFRMMATNLAQPQRNCSSKPISLVSA